MHETESSGGAITSKSFPTVAVAVAVPNVEAAPKLLDPNMFSDLSGKFYSSTSFKAIEGYVYVSDLTISREIFSLFELFTRFL